MKFLRKLPFIVQLFVMGAIPIMLLGIAMGIIMFRNADSTVKDSEKEVIADTINRIDININVKARQLDGFVRNIAGSYQMRRVVNDWSSLGGVSEQNRSEISGLLTNTLGTFSEVLSMHVIIGREDILGHAGSKGLRLDLLEQMLSKTSISGERVIWSDVSDSIRAGESGKVIGVYEGIRDKDGKAIGVILVEVSPVRIGSMILTKQKILRGQSTFVTDRKGTLVYSDGAVDDSIREAAYQLYKDGGRSNFMDVDSVSFFTCAQYNALTNWIVFSTIEESALFPGAGLLRSNTLMLVIIATAAASLFLFLLSTQVVKPLGRLKRGMKEVQNKNFSVRIDNDRSDEIGELTESFNYMTEQINTLVNQVYREKLAQKSAEIEALQAQINPHFLYNTLDSINWMLIDRDEMNISRIVVALGKLMQYSMDNKTTMVTLDEELGYIRDYFLIQKNRLEDRLEFEIEADHEAGRIFVPKLILQPLVENAIKYGIEPMEKGGRVVVKVEKLENIVRISVHDNGKGMDDEQLARFRELLKSDSSDHTSIGVHNVVRRLQLHFNDNCSFHVTSKLYEGMCLSIEIPVEQGFSEETEGGRQHEHIDH